MAELKPDLDLNAIDFDTLSIKRGSLIETIDPIT